jgi:hypothetical protein
MADGDIAVSDAPAPALPLEAAIGEPDSVVGATVIALGCAEVFTGIVPLLGGVLAAPPPRPAVAAARLPDTPAAPSACVPATAGHGVARASSANGLHAVHNTASHR